MSFDKETIESEYVPEVDCFRIRQVRIDEAVEATLNSLHVGNIDTTYLEVLRDATNLENEFDVLLNKLEQQVNSAQEQDFIVSEFAKLLDDEQKRENA